MLMMYTNISNKVKYIIFICRKFELADFFASLCPSPPAANFVSSKKLVADTGKNL